MASCDWLKPRFDRHLREMTHEGGKGGWENEDLCARLAVSLPSLLSNRTWEKCVFVPDVYFNPACLLAVLVC